MMKPSDLTVTDVFCGAGGNTIGAKRAGLRVRVGLNHWDRAIETYGTNNPEVDVVERVDVSLCDPRRYPSTDIAVMSPECTTHSPAGGNRHKRSSKPDLLDGDGRQLDPATVRSRVTMFDVVRFTEYHRYRIVIVENVVEATRWELFPDWLQMMARLGYEYRILSLNSMFFHPTPQSRDRIYVVFWAKGNPAPDLEYRPLAPCAKCGNVESVRAWKNGRTIGKHKRQYIYVCPTCAAEVTPYYFAALNALDFSLAAERIGDRDRPLKPRTLERIQYGLEKYGNRVLVIRDGMTSGLGFRAADAATAPHFSQPATHYPLDGVAHPAPFILSDQLARRVYPLEAPLPTQSASRPHDAIVSSPFLVECAYAQDLPARARGVDEPAWPQTTQQSSALVMPMFLATAGSRDSEASASDPMPTQTASERLGVVSAPVVLTLRGTGGDQVREHSAQSATDPLGAMTSGGVHHALVQDSPMIVPIQGNARPRAASDVLPTQLAKCSHDMLISGAAQISLRDADAMRVAGLDREMMTQGTKPQQALISRAPFIVSHYGTTNVAPADRALATVTSIDRHEFVRPGEQLKVEDCYFRMLQPHEIGAAMAFPSDYRVEGSKRERVKMYGNAVTPPVMDAIIRRCAQSLHSEITEEAFG